MFVITSEARDLVPRHHKTEREHESILQLFELEASS